MCQGGSPPSQPSARQSWCILVVSLPSSAPVPVPVPPGFPGAVLALVSAIACAVTSRFLCAAFEALETLPPGIRFLFLLRCSWIQRGCHASLSITAVPLCVASGLQGAGERLLSVPAAVVPGLSKPRPLPVARRAAGVMGCHLAALSSPRHTPARSSWTSVSLSGQRIPSQQFHLSEHPVRQSPGWPGTQTMTGGADTVCLAKRYLRDHTRSRDLSQEKLGGSISLSPSRCHLRLLPPPGASPTQVQGHACQPLCIPTAVPSRGSPAHG